MDTAFFLSLLKPGDLVEFQRDGYQHWAVFIGKLSNKESFVYSFVSSSSIVNVLHVNVLSKGRLQYQTCQFQS